MLDGELVDKARILYGDKELTTTAPDGTEILVTVDSGMIGELTRAQLRRADGSWVDLESGSRGREPHVHNGTQVRQRTFSGDGSLTR